MSEAYGPDFITVTDEDGKEFELELVDTLEHNGVTYHAMFPAVAEDEETGEPVDVDADDSYVIGVLFDLSLPIFVCYGIPGVRTVPPPREIAPSCVWLPLDNDRPDAEGYWMIYQSATDGKCVT